MAQFQTRLDDTLIEFIRQQPMFFTASATDKSRINCSPKGTDSLRVLDESTVAYLDITGSGNETAAHITNDGRLTIMFCSFGEKPLILRLYGRGELVQPDEQRWPELIAKFGQRPGQRQIVLLHIESLQTSCGFGVPYMTFKGDRPDLQKWAEKKGSQGLADYRATKNVRSIDGLSTGMRISR